MLKNRFTSAAQRAAIEAGIVRNERRQIANVLCITARLAATSVLGRVESRMGAVAWGLWPALRFPSPLIEPDVPISGIRLSGRLRHKAFGCAR
jgi:hypothetical protein